MKQRDRAKETDAHGWFALKSRKDEFSRILKLLTDFDDRTGRAKRYPDPETHLMRKAIAIANPDLVRIYLRRIATDVFSIVSELKCDSGIVVTGWVTEDGIHTERATQPSDHPVHNIVCITDLFERDSAPFEAPDDLNPATEQLMREKEFATQR